MKKELYLFVILILMGCNSPAENKPGNNETTSPENDSAGQAPPAPIHYTVPDRSPMDMVYFPVNYPLLKMTGHAISQPYARVIYSRPQKQNRKVFGDLIRYNEPWRLGANEATEIEFFSPVLIQDKTIKAGRYILYCIPQETKWTIVLNTNLYSWGLEQNRGKDLVQFEVPVEINTLSVEYFTISFEKRSDTTADLVFLWDEVKVKLTLNF